MEHRSLWKYITFPVCFIIYLKKLCSFHHTWHTNVFISIFKSLNVFLKSNRFFWFFFKPLALLLHLLCIRVRDWVCVKDTNVHTFYSNLYPNIYKIHIYNTSKYKARIKLLNSKKSNSILFLFCPLKKSSASAPNS